MIPKTIHYCWFGRGRKPLPVRKCLKSWRRVLPDYQIIEWNEENYDLASAPLFVRQAIEAKMWAFATDYIRYDVIYRNGGIFFDTDVELLRSLDPLLEDAAFFGIQYNNQVASGLGFGAEKGAPVLLELMNNYRDIPFFMADGLYDITPCPKRDLPVFLDHGFRTDGSEQILDGNIHIYPKEVFCPCGPDDRIRRKTGNTIADHHFAASWYTPREQLKKRLRKTLGKERFDRLMRLKRRIAGDMRCR